MKTRHLQIFSIHYVCMSSALVNDVIENGTAMLALIMTEKIMLV